MRIKLDLNAKDLQELNDPETTKNVKEQARILLDTIFEEKDELIKCSITMDDKGE